MKIGIFDSGIGGLIIAKSLSENLPAYDYIYFGDTLHVPYGGRSQEAIYEFSKNAIAHLFKQGCGLIIIACNTASASALRRLQQEYLPKHYPNRRILGVIIPTAEAVIKEEHQRVGLLATSSTIQSGIYSAEISKLNPAIELFEQDTPLLVPLIENNGCKWVKPILAEYLAPLLEKNIQSLILGCTHYPFLKKEIKSQVGKDINLISQDEIIPDKLKDYLARHPEIESNLSKNNDRIFEVTDLTSSYTNAAQTLYGEEILFKKV
ncbi:MAG: glutamate racemase [Alphaproteobacteria bacterium]